MERVRASGWRVVAVKPVAKLRDVSRCKALGDPWGVGWGVVPVVTLTRQYRRASAAGGS